MGGGWEVYTCTSVLLCSLLRIPIVSFQFSLGGRKKKKVRKVGVCSLLNTRESTAASSIINTSRFKILEKLYTDIQLPEQIHMG